ncbi:MAG: hypothetical protein KGQ62_03920 [Gammaproteobacteria bacterium]|nr:hypothetical protein [Gammaproteobacteria bacterium]MBU6508920.1 hypothetical protein [Gammaproteobacteria bacterium]MDE1983350.1 hypothetical protein [Gammaproteobacteria bacterium]MDE2108102.1 hypothetical protein [Gammaproteobacteria bacterium]
MISNRLSRWTLLFFAVALLNFLVAQGVLISGLTWPAQSLSAPVTLIAVHLLTIGWLLLLMLGALFQFIPVITSRPLPSQTLTLVTLIAIELGLIGMVCGFLALNFANALLAHCLPVGGALVIVGVLLACYDIGVPLLKARPMSLPARLVLTGLAFLLLTVTLGLLLALALSVSGFAVYVAPLLAQGVAYHALAGLGGWFTLTAMGVSYKLLPMFTLAPEERGRAGEAVLQLGATGFALAVAAGLIRAWHPAPLLSILSWLGDALVALAIGIYLWDVVRIFRSRKRAVIELHNKAAVGAFIMLGGTTLLAIVLMSLGVFAAHVGVFVFLVLFGWLSGLGLTQLYKIVPFLTWLGRFGQQLGRGPVPRVQDLVDEAHSYPWFVIYFIAVLLAALAGFAGSAFVFQAGVGLSALATIGLAFEYWRAWRAYYPRLRPSKPPVPPFKPGEGIIHGQH